LPISWAVSYYRFSNCLTSRCWVQDDKEGWIGAEVTNKEIIGTKVALTLKLENDTVSIVISGLKTCYKG
jgi:hypothetical protein